ncbi:MAG: hypothetical protein ACYC35_18950 [Pirellulales bacterium]
MTMPQPAAPPEQVVPLPPVRPYENPVTPAGYEPLLTRPDTTAPPLFSPPQPPNLGRDVTADLDVSSQLAGNQDAAPLPPGVKRGPLQQVSLLSTWLAGGCGPTDFGMNDEELTATVAFPFPTRESPLVLTPGFGVHYLEGPVVSDLPPRLFDAFLDVRWLRQVTPWLGVDVAVTPGMYSDFEQNDSDALRIGGRGLGAITCSPTTKIVLGAMYLDRVDIKVLPVGGVIWTPTEDLRYDLIFPKPKLAWRWSAVEGDFSQWVYISGELGGGSWAIQRTSGAQDIATVRDYRVMLGVERKVAVGLNSLFEVGYVFNRRIEYASDTPDVEPRNTVMLRGGLYY